MFFYDNYLELDEYNQLPMNHATTLRMNASNDESWVGCKNGEIYKINLKTSKAIANFSTEQPIVDLIVKDDYLFSLSNNSVQLFNTQSLFNLSTQYDLNKRIHYKNQINDSHLVNLGSQTMLSACELSNDQYLLGGCLNEMFLFDVNYLNVIKKFPLIKESSNCTKIKRIESKNLLVTSSIGGHITIYDETSMELISTYKPFKISIFDFDLVNDNFIFSTGFDRSYSSQSCKSINIFDLRKNSQNTLFDTTRFYSANYVRGLPRSAFCLTMNKNGLGQLNTMDHSNSFRSKCERFSIQLQPNSTICACELSSDSNSILTAEKNGKIRLTTLNSKSNETICQIQINDIAYQSDDLPEDLDTPSTESFERDYKIRSHFFINPNMDHLDNSYGVLNDISRTNIYN